MNDAGHALARAIASAANLLDLDRVVIGGGVAKSGDLLFAPLRRELRRRARLVFTQNMEILPAQLGTEAGAIGAAGLVFQQPGLPVQVE
jgi:glucokinase